MIKGISHDGILTRRQWSKSLLADYRREVGKRRLYGIALLLALVLVAIAASVVADVRPGTLVENLFRFTSYLGRILPDLTIANFWGDLAAWYWNLGGWLKMLFETLLIAYLATLIGAVVAFAASFAASSNMAPIRRFASSSVAGWNCCALFRKSSSRCFSSSPSALGRWPVYWR